MSEMNEQLHNLRHSAAHLLAHAVTELFPGTKMTIGPVTETGFFYDFLPTTNFKEEDLPRIEARMRELAKKDYKIVGGQVPKAEARERFNDNQFKLELIDEIPGDTVGIYSQGDFYDLCRGGHTSSTGDVKHFQLTSISGSYWRANREGVALQRISGIAFETKEDLDAYLQRLEEVKMYDHRRLGKELDLFSFHEEAPGMPFFHHKGLLVYNKLIEFIRSLLRKDNQEIRTPLMMAEDLWKTSGHYDFYKDKMYFCTIDEQTDCVRPMNCPGSILIYKERPRSYRELPLRLAEFGYVHRYELSGVLHGLFRVRAFTIDDGHIYCTIDQVGDEVLKVLALADKVYRAFNFSKIKIAISTRPEKYMGDDQDFEKATNSLKSALDRTGVAYIIQEGEGAFYGPKIEIVIEDSMGREWQCGTVQVDFTLPTNFDLEYIASDQSKKRPVIVHRAILGSIERFLGMVLEHCKGRLPFWIAPVQARILMITDHQSAYATSLYEQLTAHGLRVEIDTSGDKISAQIRRAQMDKVPWMLVLGKKEEEQKTVTLRLADGQQQGDLTVHDLCAKADALNAEQSA
ncbi:threonine--tRNA ligase [Candidatus Babeliales bacterium]|nr:threonine--tRNA ligase [Candidatus Babeliales bacterium]